MLLNKLKILNIMMFNHQGSLRSSSHTLMMVLIIKNVYYFQVLHVKEFSCVFNVIFTSLEAASLEKVVAGLSTLSFAFKITPLTKSLISRESTDLQEGLSWASLSTTDWKNNFC